MQDEVNVTQADREAAASIAVLVEMRELILSGRADHHAEPFARHRHQAEREEEEAYEIGIDEGRQEMVREIDQATGGDGEFRWSTEPDRHCPDAETMKARVLERFHQAERDTLARMEWRDSTAEAPPRDGTRILVQNDRGIFTVEWDGDDIDGWWICPDGKHDDRPLHGDATKYWMPLPPAPEAGQ